MEEFILDDRECNEASDEGRPLGRPPYQKPSGLERPLCERWSLSVSLTVTGAAFWKLGSVSESRPSKTLKLFDVKRRS